MRREHFITFAQAFGGIFGAAALMAAPLLILDPPHHTLWLACFLIGLALMAVCFGAALVTALGDRAERQDLERRGKMIPLIGMVACGAGLLAFSGWYFWPTPALKTVPVAAKAAPSTEPLDGALLYVGRNSAWGRWRQAQLAHLGQDTDDAQRAELPVPPADRRQVVDGVLFGREGFEKFNQSVEMAKHGSGVLVGKNTLRPRRNWVKQVYMSQYDRGYLHALIDGREGTHTTR